MRNIIVGLILLMTLAGCSLDDPLGATTRQSIRANAYVEAARVQADAQKEIAQQETVRASIWASMVIPGLLILVGGTVATVIVWWQGRIWLARAERAGSTALTCQREHPQLRQIRLLAQQQGYDVEVDGSVAYLVNNGRRVGQRMLTGS